MFTADQLGLDDPEKYAEAEQRHARAAEEQRARGDSSGEGRSLLAVAWALEKQGLGHAALEHAERARSLLAAAGDLRNFAECCHSIGVWRFHHLDDEPPVGDFRQAIEARMAIPDLMTAARSWHNLGFVQLVAGRADDAADSYEHAAALLHRERAGSETASAFRQLGFIHSHRAYAAARFGSVTEALRATITYFEHVERTGVHREPVYAYLAPGIALASGTAPPAGEMARLEALVGHGTDPQAWLAEALRRASSAMTSHVETGTGRHAYLGAHLYALLEMARWHDATGSRSDGDRLVSEADQLARARGWLGEAARLHRRRDE